MLVSLVYNLLIHHADDDDDCKIMTMKTNTRLMLRPVTSRGQRQFLIRVNDRPAVLDYPL